MHFGQPPRLANGIFLRTWKSGPEKNQPKLPPAVRTMMERGLLEVRQGPRGVRAVLTEAGFAAVRLLVADRRLMNPADFAHLRRELELEDPEQFDSTGQTADQ
ncbi:MAG: hypothetical protein M3Y55_11660 [Pseudomonadota bacterium]|nr:hypothetical protein [Pseudomonadota bacterium]MDQ2762325.1 hypothetical protein [Pseudomonadota bacterium]